MSVVDRIRRYANVQLVVPDKEAADVYKVCEVTKQFFRSQGPSMVAWAAGRPLLHSYSCDGTPCRAKKYCFAEVAGRTLRRAGGDTAELLVQRTLLRAAKATGEVKTAAILSDPMPMTRGKKLPAQFSCCLRHWQSLRMLGHTGICVQHYCFDRGVHQGLVRLFRKKHGQLAAEASNHAVPDGAPLYDPALLEWIVDTPCANHDIHNAFKWSVMQCMSDAQLMTDTFIAIESLRNAYSHIQSVLSEWLLTAVKFVPPQIDRQAADAALWTALGVEPNELHTFLDLALRWDGTHLEVSNVHADSPDVWQRLVNVLLYVHKFKKFSTSRWCSVGQSCRTIVAALLLGLDDLASFVIKHPLKHNSYINGYKRLQGRAKHFCCLAALAAYPCDYLLGELLEDDRIVKNMTQLKEGVADEVKWLHSLPADVYETLGKLCGLSGGEFRSDTLAAIGTSVGFMNTQIWSAVSAGPWALAQGNIAENLEALKLKAAPPCSDSTSRNIWQLLREGCGIQYLVEGVSLLLDIGWSSATVEQQHASASVMRRAHPQLAVNMICARALLHTTIKLLSVDKDQRALERKQQRLSKLVHKRRACVGSRQLFFKLVVGRAKERKGIVEGDVGDALECKLTREEQVQYFKAASSGFKKLSQSHLEALSDEAHEVTENKNNTVAEEISCALAALELHTARQAEEQAAMGRPRLQFNSCLLSDEQKALMADLHKSNLFKLAHVAELRQVATHAPLPLTHQAMKDLEDVAIFKAPKCARPRWLSDLCWRRHMFNHTALVVIGEEGSPSFWKFLYAKQSPLTACFSPMERCATQLPAQALSSSGAAESALFDYWDYSFRYDPCVTVEAHDIVCSAECHLEVLWGLVDRGHCACLADGPTISFNYFIKDAPRRQAREKKTDNDESDSEVSQGEGLREELPWAGDKSIAEEFPWLFQEMIDENWRCAAAWEPPAKKAKRSAPEDREPDESTSSESEPEDTPLDDETIQAVFDDVEKLRAKWHADHDKYAADDFSGCILGNTWTKKKTGKSADNVLFQANSAEAVEWAELYNLHKSRRASIISYELSDATIICREWAKKMQYYYDIYKSSGDPGYTYTADDHNAYEPLPEFMALAARDNLPKTMPPAIRSVQKMRPRNLPF